MCNVCCKQFTRWCKAFTKTEILLCVLQAILLIVFISFLTFLILHLVACSRNKLKSQLSAIGIISIDENGGNTYCSEHTKAVLICPKDCNMQTTTKHVTKTISEVVERTEKIHVSANTVDKSVLCTWKPSDKTEAFTYYYENVESENTTLQINEKQNIPFPREDPHEMIPERDLLLELEHNTLAEGLTDGKEINDTRKDFLLALVKIKPPQDITFGCTLTIISEYWTLTAASCIEAIEEVDSLDSFVMMKGLKEHKQNIHPVEDIMIHPLYQGVNLTYDLAALKSESRLVKERSLAVTLPSMVDYFLITVGERLTILGYGRFRNIDRDPLTRSVREVWLHRVPASQCRGGRAGEWSPRRLGAGAAVARGACGAAPVCAGVLRSRRAPCTYCAGTPLFSERVLLGVMSDNEHCGLSCEPALFSNLALVSDWLHSVLDTY